MAGFFGRLGNSIAAGFVLAALVLAFCLYRQGFDAALFGPFLLRWFQALAAIVWLGVMVFFNVAGLPPALPEQARRQMVPVALLWARWAALVTVLCGIALALLQGQSLAVLTFGAAEGFVSPRAVVEGLGLWLALIMAYNEWVLISPRPREVSAARFQRINLMLAIPMLCATIAARTLL